MPARPPHPDTRSPLSPREAYELARYLTGLPTLERGQLQGTLAQEIADALLAVNGGDRQAALDGYLATLSPPEADAIRRAIFAADPAGDPPADPRRLVTLEDLADLLPATCWLWPGWLPRGYLTLLVSVPGYGKSALALALTAATLGLSTWPDRTRPQDTSPCVVWVDVEASQAILLERVNEWGLPRKRILTPCEDPDDPLAALQLDKPAGWQTLVDYVAECRPALVVIDSLRGCHRGDENSSELAGLLQKMAELARDWQVAVLVLHHLRKGHPAERLESVTLDRIRGSTAIVALSRVVMAIDEPDPADSKHKRLQVIKSNLAAFPPPLGFSVAESGIAYGPAPEPPREETQKDRAVNLLLALLKDGPRPATEIFAEAKQAGLSDNTLRRAQKTLRIRPDRQGTEWVWCLPGTPREDTQVEDAQDAQEE